MDEFVHKPLSIKAVQFNGENQWEIISIVREYYRPKIEKELQRSEYPNYYLKFQMDFNKNLTINIESGSSSSGQFLSLDRSDWFVLIDDRFKVFKNDDFKERFEANK